MLPIVLQSAEGVTDTVEFRLTVDRLPDGRTWTYQPTAWRVPDGPWMKIVNEKPVQVADIKAVEARTGWKMNWHGFKLSTFDWVYAFQKQAN